MQQAGMYHVLLFFLWLSVAGALKIHFPPSGTPTAALDSQTISWTRDNKDPPDQFFIQKIKLDDGNGPSAKSTPVPISNSQEKSGTSPFMFNRAGLFQILAVDIQNEQTFFSTEVTVDPNPTSSISPTPSSTSSSQHSNSTSSASSTAGSKNSTSNSKGSSSDGDSGKGDNMMATSTTAHSTTATGAPSTSSDISTVPATASNHTAAIIGGVVGSVAVLFIISATLLCLRYRTRRDTSMFVRAKMVRYDSDPLDGQWTASPDLEKDLEKLPSLSPLRRNSLRPQDSASNIYHIGSILPPIPAARSIASSDAVTSVSSSSSARRLRDRNTPRLSVSTLSTSTSTSGSLFPVPTLPPRTRTDRQMLIEEDIQRLQARILFLQEHNGNASPISRLEGEQELTLTNARVDLLKKMHESKWALGLTDEVPEGLF